MRNPDPTIYTCWQEFARQLFWDYQMGEAFVMPWDGNTGFPYPNRFRVVPPWAVTVDMKDGRRTYKIGSKNVTDDILHIRYHSNTTDARGQGPLDQAMPRMAMIGLLQRYVSTLAETGGVPLYWIGVDRRLGKGEAKDLQEQWMETRVANAGQPAILGSNATLNQAKNMSARDMSLLELSQFSESRIAILLGVPPFLVGLAGAAGSLTYSNIADLFDFHDRSSLRPKTKMIMDSLSGWALPNGRSAEVNRDDYTRLPLDKRAQIYKTLGPIESGGIGVLTTDEMRIMERFFGSSAGAAAQALTGGSD
jgi:HK97 family phage portal protein